MKKIACAAAAGLFVGAFAGQGIARAQTPSNSPTASSSPQVFIEAVGAPTTDLPMQQYNEFDRLMQDNPDVTQALARNPHLINSQRFLSAHRDLRDFLQTHPDVRAGIEQDPGNFLPLSEVSDVPRWSYRNSPNATTNSSSMSAANNSANSEVGSGTANAGAETSNGSAASGNKTEGLRGSTPASNAANDSSPAGANGAAANSGAASSAGAANGSISQ
jgi:hypothetical protein